MAYIYSVIVIDIIDKKKIVWLVYFAICIM